jgi:hypothetical protein
MLSVLSFCGSLVFNVHMPHACLLARNKDGSSSEDN